MATGRRLARRPVVVLCTLPLVSVAVLCLAALCAPCPHPLAGRDFSPIVEDRDGNLLRLALTQDHKYRLHTRVADIPPRALEAILAYEDRWFWQHPGVNMLALIRSCAAMLLGGRRMGGSTITMQVARLAFGLKTATITGKLRQIWLALCLERHYDKGDILEAYFSLAPYGGNVEGLAAASQVYFHKWPERLTDAESEALMLVPQNPVARRPATDNATFVSAVRRQWHGDGEYAPLRIFAPADLPFRAPHVCDELLAGRDADSAGTRIRTTISLPLQQKVEHYLSRFVARHASRGLDNAAALLLHWPSMEIRALAGSADFFADGISGQLDGTRARRSPGSTLKPFIFALGLEQGLIHPHTLMLDTPRSFAGYDPENFDRSFRGPIPAAEALRASRNIPALSLAARLRNPNLFGFLKRAGVDFLSSEEHYGLALVLGGAEVTMREMAALYAMLANGGAWQAPRLVRGPTPPSGPAQGGANAVLGLLSPEAAFVTLSMLEDGNPDHRVTSRGGVTLPLRFKTGTSNGFRDAWTCGIVGPYVLVVWVGNFDNRPNPLLVGGQVAAPLFVDMARGLARDEAMQDTLAEPAPGLNVQKIDVCAATGDLELDMCREHVTSWFIPGVSPVKPTGVLRTIHVDRTTGLRACLPEEGRTEERIWEFWPSEMAAMFARAGLPKPAPPAFEQQCRDMAATGRAPRIQQPREGLAYHASLASGGTASIALMAHADADAGTLHWFVNGVHAGDTAPGEVLVWQSGPGELHILVTDDARRSASRSLVVSAAP